MIFRAAAIADRLSAEVNRDRHTARTASIMASAGGGNVVPARVVKPPFVRNGKVLV